MEIAKDVVINKYNPINDHDFDDWFVDMEGMMKGKKTREVIKHVINMTNKADRVLFACLAVKIEGWMRARVIRLMNVNVVEMMEGREEVYGKERGRKDERVGRETRRTVKYERKEGDEKGMLSVESSSHLLLTQRPKPFGRLGE